MSVAKAVTVVGLGKQPQDRAAASSRLVRDATSSGVWLMYMANTWT